MAINVQLLDEICTTPGAPGHEHRIREVLLNAVQNHIDEHYIDNIGNLVCVKKGSGNTGKKIALAAHMDEISFMISHIEENGFARFHPLGGFDPKTLVSQRVIAHGKEDLVGVIAIKPIHIASEEDRKKTLKLNQLVIDFGMPGDQLKNYLSVGDPVTRKADLIEMGDCVTGKSLDNRVSCYVQVEALRQFEGCEHDVYAAFTVQEEVGLRGAGVLANTIDPDWGIAIDTTISYDLPGGRSYERITSLGEGVGIKMVDSGVIADKRFVSFFQAQCEAHNIRWQPEVMTRGGTDTAMLQRGGRNGAIAGAISIPTRHIHTTVETCHKEDIAAGIQLLTKSLKHLHEGQWGW